MDIDRRTTAEAFDLLLEAMVSPDGVRPGQETMPLLCEKVSELLGSDAAILRLVDPDGGALRVAAVSNMSGLLRPDALETATNEVLSLRGLDTHIVRRGALPPSVEAFLTGEMQVMSSVDAGPLFAMRAMCMVPLVRRGRSLGVLALYWSVAHEPGVEEVRVIKAAAKLVAFCVEVTQATDAVRSVCVASESSARAAADERDEAEQIIAFAEQAMAAAVRNPGPQALLSLLAEHGVSARIVAGPADAGGGEDSRGIVGAAGIHGRLDYTTDAHAGHRLVEIAGRMLAIEFDRMDRERALESAPERALHLLVHPDPAPSEAHRAESVLNLASDGTHVLLVAEFDDAERALIAARAVGGALASATAIADGARVIVLAVDAAGVRRAGGMIAAVGLGSAGPVRPGLLRQALKDATTAARISRARGGRLVAFEDVGTVLSMASSVPEVQARALIDELLAPIEDYDRRQDARLMDTLVAYLALNGSPTATARRLHVHVNTVKQRLERISALLDADIKDFGLVARLTLALEWRSLLTS